MLSSLLRPRRDRRRVQEEHSPFSSPFVDRSSPIIARQERRAAQHASADFTETEEEDEITEEEDGAEEGEEDDEGAEVVEDDNDDDHEQGDEDGEDSPLLPIFSAAHLDSIPIYNLTHAIRLIVLPRTETTLTWDQLRSPQVSSFLVKPMQQQIRTSHFSRASLYALMANCLQFQKEGQANPGNAGVSRTRALVCELLAIKLLREYNTRELIDALSYDFYPLQGIASGASNTNIDQRNRPRPAAARTSTLEVAIRASAKRFLAHPVVVQQLEAIWAGTIVFHSAADNLHRRQITPPMQEHPKPSENRYLLVPGQNTGYGSSSRPTASEAPARQFASTRRTVTLYDPRDASLFKLSRLRVPRYRQFFSTCSLAILLGLFLAVLSQRSMDITTLEIVFWLWSAGFMLDEVVGFNEQGFSLYIMSFWNTFDLGILLLLVVFYCMRLYGIFLVDVGRHDWNGMAYDVLATNAILLFPRLFSVLDHYRYFSQLLIAFRLMAVDLVAVFILILVACSGFFVAFTLSFGRNEYDAAGVAYKIFQILMGFTPAAWEAWDTYNPLGKAILVLFLFICHFLVVTILITVLTNSFMAIVSNANEEHQFVFAVNTISMVKNDALFSYVAPSNIFAWLLTPLRFCLPFRGFIKVNRTAIKVTHFPLLFGIYAYERLLLARSVFEPTDLVENPGRNRKRLLSFQDKSRLFSPRVDRQESVAGFQKDSALDEVFRLAPGPDSIRSTRRTEKTHNVVNKWMDHQGDAASPPQEQDLSVVDRLEKRLRARKATLLRQRGVSGTRSVASDPADFLSSGGFFKHDGNDVPASNHDQPDDEDGDDEMVTNEDQDDGMTLDKRTTRSHHPYSDRDNEESEDREDNFETPATTRMATPSVPPKVLRSSPRSSPPRRRGHNRTVSTATILYNPREQSTASSPPRSRPSTAKRQSKPPTGANTPQISGNRTPKPSMTVNFSAKVKSRPILPARQNFQSMPNFNLDSRVAPSASAREKPRQVRHRRSSLDMGMSDLGLEHNAPGMNMMLGAVPSSFATQMALATGGLKAFGGRADAKADEGTDGMMGRLMLARMKTLEEGFAEVVREFRGMRTAGNSSVEGSLGGGGGGGGGVGLWDAHAHAHGRRDKGKGREKERRAEPPVAARRRPVVARVARRNSDHELGAAARYGDQSVAVRGGVGINRGHGNVHAGQYDDQNQGEHLDQDQDQRREENETPEGSILRSYISKGSSL